MRERDIPENWSPDMTASEPDNIARLSRMRHDSETHRSGVSSTGSVSKSVQQRMINPSDSTTRSKPAVASGRNSGKLPRWTKSWVLWTVLLALVPGGIGVMAMAMLFKLPSAPNCPEIFWPLASASVRMHCAQLAASKQTVKDLLQAIDLVKNLPENHPLRGEINRSVEQWSRDILNLANESFQAGRLDEAIEIANKIPKELAPKDLVEERIAKWRSIWSKAEGIYKEAENQTRERNWHQAYMISARLQRVDNRYWGTAKYEELNALITSARDDGEKLAKAEDLAKTQNVQNILKAINIASSIGQSSIIYPKAQEAIPIFGRKMLELAQAKLNGRNVDDALEIARQIPPINELQQDTQDFITIAEAQRSAWDGSVSGLETAIATAQQIDSSRPDYQKAQGLIAGWQLEIEDVNRLEKARALASQGTITDLTSAIAEVQLIPANNPRGREARSEAARWRGQIETIEDRPYIDRAEQLAMMEDINSLQAAITEASQIRRGRALYREAQGKIYTWNAKIQRIQDQPYLDRARELAASGNLPAAIATAQQIAPGRSLAREAQTAIADWDGKVRAKQNWGRAREVALQGTPDSLVEAIRLARRVPRSSAMRGDADIAIEQWSEQLLEIARNQALSDLGKGIETAKMVPKGTAIYSIAREQIREWRELLNPQPEVQPEVTSGTGSYGN